MPARAEGATRRRRKVAAVAEPQGPRPLTDEEIVMCFALFDADGGGSIDQWELADCLRSLGMPLSREEVEVLLHELDDDGSGTIDIDEFAALVRRLDTSEDLRERRDAGFTQKLLTAVTKMVWTPTEIKHFKDMFAQFDDDASGYITAKELHAALGSMSGGALDSLEVADIEGLLEDEGFIGGEISFVGFLTLWASILDPENASPAAKTLAQVMAEAASEDADFEESHLAMGVVSLIRKGLDGMLVANGAALAAAAQKDDPATKLMRCIATVKAMNSKVRVQQKLQDFILDFCGGGNGAPDAFERICPPSNRIERWSFWCRYRRSEVLRQRCTVVDERRRRELDSNLPNALPAPRLGAEGPRGFVEVPSDAELDGDDPHVITLHDLGPTSRIGGPQAATSRRGGRLPRMIKRTDTFEERALTSALTSPVAEEIWNSGGVSGGRQDLAMAAGGSAAGSQVVGSPDGGQRSPEPVKTYASVMSDAEMRRLKQKALRHRRFDTLHSTARSVVDNRVLRDCLRVQPEPGSADGHWSQLSKEGPSTEELLSPSQVPRLDRDVFYDDSYYTQTLSWRAHVAGRLGDSPALAAGSEKNSKPAWAVNPAIVRAGATGGFVPHHWTSKLENTWSKKHAADVLRPSHEEKGNPSEEQGGGKSPAMSSPERRRVQSLEETLRTTRPPGEGHQPANLPAPTKERFLRHSICDGAALSPERLPSGQLGSGDRLALPPIVANVRRPKQTGGRLSPELVPISSSTWAGGALAIADRSLPQEVLSAPSRRDAAAHLFFTNCELEGQLPPLLRIFRDLDDELGTNGLTGAEQERLKAVREAEEEGGLGRGEGGEGDLVPGTWRLKRDKPAQGVIDLSNSDLSDRTMTCVLDSLEHLEKTDKVVLRELVLSGNSRLTSRSIVALCQRLSFREMQSLRLNGSLSRLTVDSARALTGRLRVADLRALDLRDVGVADEVWVTDMVELLEQCPNLGDLCVSNCGLGRASQVACVRFFAALARHCGKLVSLDVSRNHIFDVGMRALGTLGTRMTSLKSLNMAGIAGDGSGLLPLVELLPRAFPNLEVLDLSHSNVNAVTALHLEDAVSQHPSLADLLLEHSPLGERGLECILRLVCRSNTLRSVNIEAFREDASLARAEALAQRDDRNTNAATRGVGVSAGSAGAAGAAGGGGEAASAADALTAQKRTIWLHISQPNRGYLLNANSCFGRLCIRLLVEHAERLAVPVEQAFTRFQRGGRSVSAAQLPDLLRSLSTPPPMYIEGETEDSAAAAAAADKKKKDKKKAGASADGEDLVSFLFKAELPLAGARGGQVIEGVTRSTRMTLNFKRFVVFASIYASVRTDPSRLMICKAAADSLILKFSHMRHLVLKGPPHVRDKLVVTLLPACGEDFNMHSVLSLVPVNVQSNVRSRVRKLMLFNPDNPTAHFNLGLIEATDYAVASRLMLLNQWERNVSLAQDAPCVSRHGDRQCLLNIRADGRNVSRVRKLTLPAAGESNMQLELDYASPWYVSSKDDSPDAIAPTTEYAVRRLCELLNSSSVPDGSKVRAIRTSSHKLSLGALDARRLLNVVDSVTSEGKPEQRAVNAVQRSRYDEDEARVELFICLFARVSERRRLCSPLVLYDQFRFSHAEAGRVAHRLGRLQVFDMMNSCQRVPSNGAGGNRYVLDLSVYQERRLAQALIVLAAAEDGENLIDCDYSEATFMAEGVQRSYIIPAFWLQEPPQVGTISLTYVSEKAEYVEPGERMNLGTLFQRYHDDEAVGIFEPVPDSADEEEEDDDAGEENPYAKVLHDEEARKHLRKLRTGKTRSLNHGATLASGALPSGALEG